MKEYVNKKRAVIKKRTQYFIIYVLKTNMKMKLETKTKVEIENNLTELQHFEYWHNYCLHNS